MKKLTSKEYRYIVMAALGILGVVMNGMYLEVASPLLKQIVMYALFVIWGAFFATAIYSLYRAQ